MSINLDGPALSVLQPHKARQLLPLSRISRIIASGPVELSTEALLACAERGITVTFLHRDGQIRAYLFGDSPGRDGLWQRLHDFLDRPDWKVRYSDWECSINSRLRRILCNWLQLSLDAYSLSEIECQLREYQAKQIGIHQRGFLAGRLHGMTAALVAELLAEVGLGAEQQRALGNRIDLSGSLVRWLLLDLQIPFINWLQEQPCGAAIKDKTLVMFFESQMGRLHQLGCSIVNKLHRFLVEL
jgi:hypothetical protein